MRKARANLTYANVAATIALVVSIGGGTAVALDGKNSVDSGDIKKGAVHAQDLGKIKVRVSPLVNVEGGVNANGQVNTNGALASCNRKEKLIDGAAFWAGISPTSDAELYIQSETQVNGANNSGGWLVVGASDETDTHQLRSVAYCLRK